MKVIKIFLASSIDEFKAERISLEAFMSKLNNTYAKRGIYFELEICENVSQALNDSGQRKQDEYNDLIRNSDYFYLLIGRCAGIFTREELEVAIDSFRSKHKPKIYGYFKMLPETDISAENIKSYIDDRLGHYHSTFVHLDGLKLDMVLEFTRDFPGGEIKIENAQVHIDNETVDEINLLNIPLFSKNEAVKRALADKVEMDEDYAEMCREYAQRPSGRLLRSIERLNKEREELAEQIHRIETDILSLQQYAMQVRGEKLNWRESLALKEINEGNYEAAKAILRDSTWEKECIRAEEDIALALEPIRGYINGKRVLIQTIMATGLNANSVYEIRNIYEEIISLCMKYQISMDTLISYGWFLYNQNDYEQGKEIIGRLKGWIESRGKETELLLYLRTLLLLGRLFAQDPQTYDIAENHYRETLALQQMLSPNEYTNCAELLADCSCSLAILLAKKRKFKEAKEISTTTVHFSESIESEERRSVVQGYVYQTIGFVHERAHDYIVAENMYRDALAIMRKNGNIDDIAAVCCRLADLLSELGRYDEAEALYREALSILQELDSLNCDAYCAVAVWCRYGLSNSLMSPMMRIRQQEMKLHIHMEAGSGNSKSANDDNANDLNIAVKKAEEAERLMLEAIEICRSAVAQRFKMEKHLFCVCCKTHGYILRMLGRKKEAITAFSECWTIIKELFEQNPKKFKQELMNVFETFTDALRLNGQDKEEESVYIEMSDICQMHGLPAVTYISPNDLWNSIVQASKKP